MRLPFLLAFLCVSTALFGQYAISEIPRELTEGANVIVRSNETVIALNDFDDMTVYVKEAVTILNKKGLPAMRDYVHYNMNSSVSKAEIKIYDANGTQIKKYKKRDFIDVSASGNDLYNDFRIMYIEHTPRSYPFTYEFVSEMTTSSTAFIPRWNPIAASTIGVEKATYTIYNKKGIPINFKKQRLKEYDVLVLEKPNEYRFELTNTKPLKFEDLSPNISQYTPVVKAALERFQLRGKSAHVTSWKDFGFWQKSLLEGRDVIPEATKAKIDNLVAGINDDKEKTRIIYEYMQNKTRYISVQVGIGGWQPSSAQEVDELSYGDCKGLSNYTKALLESQGIKSYYTLINAGQDAPDMDEEFVSPQFNHAILTVPFGDENVFLECTSQTKPFNFMGDFTDDRMVLMMTPEGGVVAKTHAYAAKDNMQALKASVTLRDDLTISGTLNQTSEGVLYGNRYLIESATNDNMEMFYKELWGHLNNVSFGNIEFENDKRNVVFTEKFNFETSNYLSTAGDRLLLNPNIFNRYYKRISVEKDRTMPLKIRRGKMFTDDIAISLPENYVLEAAFDPIEIISKFGKYKATVVSENTTKIRYNRELVLYSGSFPPEEFNNYVAFIQRVVKKDKSKIVLSKI